MKALKTGEELDISVRLSIPETTGRHVTYFRLRTKEGNIFGQRLWADVRVIESDAGWVGVGNGNMQTALAVPVETGFGNGSLPSATASVSTPLNQAPPASEAPKETEVAAARQQSTEYSYNGNELTPDAPAAEPVAPANPLDVWGRVWAKELEVLKAMGFTDTAVLLPLLQQHVSLPVSLSPELNGVPQAEGMQKIVAELLGRSL